MSKQVHKLQPEDQKGKPAGSIPDRPRIPAETQQQKTFSQLMDNYNEFSRKRPRYIKYGLLSIFILPFVFLVLMFSLESKLFFLTLWIVSIIASAAFLIVVEYKDYWYRQLLGIDPPEENEPESPPDENPAEPVGKDGGGVQKIHKAKPRKNARKKEPSPHGPAAKVPAGSGGKEQAAASKSAQPPAEQKPIEAEDKKPV